MQASLGRGRRASCSKWDSVLPIFSRCRYGCLYSCICQIDPCRKVICTMHWVRSSTKHFVQRAFQPRMNTLAWPALTEEGQAALLHSGVLQVKEWIFCEDSLISYRVCTWMLRAAIHAYFVNPIVKSWIEEPHNTTFSDLTNFNLSIKGDF